jgi:hypothetical protein
MHGRVHWKPPPPLPPSPWLGPTLQITICCVPCLFSFLHSSTSLLYTFCIHLQFPLFCSLRPDHLIATSHGLPLQCMYITYHICNKYTSTLKVKTVHLSETPIYWYVGALVYLVGKDLLQCNSVHRTLHKGSPENEPTRVVGRNM